MEDAVGSDLTSLEFTSINSLSDELLDYIFSFLSVQERVLSEVVCRRWRDVGTLLPWTEPRSLLFDDWRWKNSAVEGNWNLTGGVLRAILSRCGAHLKQLKIIFRASSSYVAEQKPSHLSDIDKAIETAAELCPTLTEIKLKLPWIILPENCLSCLGNGCKHLKVLHLEYYGEIELSLHFLLQNCKVLESVCLSGRNLCPNEHDFEVINKNLKKIVMVGSDVKPNAVNKLLETCDCIQHLCLSLQYVREIMPRIVDRYCNTLKVINVTGPLPLQINWCPVLSKLCNLEEFTVCGFANDPVICDCGRECYAVMSNKIRVFHAVYITQYSLNFIITKVLKSNGNIESLHLDLNCEFPHPLFKLCQKYTESLTNLYLNGLRCGFAVENFCELLSLLTNLEYLTVISYEPYAHNELAKSLSSCCNQLKELDLSESDLTDEGLKYISVLPSLTSLNIRYSAVTDMGLTHLARQGRLQRLKIAKAFFLGDLEHPPEQPQISDDSCSLFARLCPNFCQLEADNFPLISNELVTAFYDSIQSGYLKGTVVLRFHKTSVTPVCKTHARLLVLFTKFCKHLYFTL